MRNNGAVTQQEYVLRDGMAIALPVRAASRVTQKIAQGVERIAQMCKASHANANRTATSASRLRQRADHLELDAASFSV
jgi:methyl-accepting chemotaxis protein